MTYLACVDIIYPACDFGLLQQKWTVFQEFYIIPHRLLQIFKLQEIYGVDLFGCFSVAWIGVLDDALEDWTREGGHTATCVVVDSYFTGSEEALRDDDATQCVFPISLLTSNETFVVMWYEMNDMNRMGRHTYATPPALRMTCASPSFMPSWSKGLDFHRVS
jgi:hypothetical protein